LKINNLLTSALTIFTGISPSKEKLLKKTNQLNLRGNFQNNNSPILIFDPTVGSFHFSFSDYNKEYGYFQGNFVQIHRSEAYGEIDLYSGDYSLTRPSIFDIYNYKIWRGIENYIDTHSGLKILDTEIYNEDKSLYDGFHYCFPLEDEKATHCVDMELALIGEKKNSPTSDFDELANSINDSYNSLEPATIIAYTIGGFALLGILVKCYFIGSKTMKQNAQNRGQREPLIVADSES
jgi:hypothetical protein